MGPFWLAQGSTGPHWTEMAVELSTETLTEEGGADGAEKGIYHNGSTTS